MYGLPIQGGTVWCDSRRRVALGECLRSGQTWTDYQLGLVATNLVTVVYICAL